MKIRNDITRVLAVSTLLALINNNTVLDVYEVYCLVYNEKMI